jgi:hypothetical protein
MPINTDELSTLSEAEIVRLRVENRAWSQELRRASTALVNRRMANEISHEEYTASRKAGREERAECDRRASVLGMG